MSKRNTTFIELNGQRYDAITGELLHASPKAPAAHHPGPRSIDGVKAPAHAIHHRVQAPAARISVKPPHAAYTVHASKEPQAKPAMDITRSQHHAHPHQPVRSHTLMRSAVKKPAGSFRRRATVQSPTDILIRKPVFAVLPKLSHTQIDPERLQRAKRIARSKLISRFSPMHPVSLAAVNGGSISIAAPVRPAKPIHQASVAVPAASPSMDVFQRALKHANAHEQPAVQPRAHRRGRGHSRPKPHHRVFSVVTASLAVLLLAGFITYQNKASLTMRFADAKAGFHATLPGQKPSGFAVGKFSYSPGVVAVNFHNGGSGKQFGLVQKPSNWNSQTLLNEYVAANNQAYQTLQTKGQTIYIYGNGNASWVNGGIWYQLTSNGALKTGDILDIASSM